MSAQSKVHSATYPGYSCAFAYIIHCKSAHKRNKIQKQITQCWEHHQTLTFGDQSIEEHFDVTNVEDYDVILGIPFLKRLGICLDFRNPAHILIGNKEVPTNKELVLGVPKVGTKRSRPMELVGKTVNE